MLLLVSGFWCVCVCVCEVETHLCLTAAFASPGHVDAGKSTLMGHLLHMLGSVDAKQMHKFRTESQKLGKGSFAFAWALDDTEEERAR